MSIRRFFLLSLLTGTSLAGAIPAIAQGGVPPPKAESALDEIVVTAYPCEPRALARHQASNNWCGRFDLREDIGKRPDQKWRITAAAYPACRSIADQGRGSVHHGSRFRPDSILSLERTRTCHDNVGREFSFRHSSS